ncbi:hypothetical protein E2A64_03555 [Pseudohoeflea suaedae]|uniref:Uncharacterized protein n=1 Tax=Pseudohoeflea suaedae TaxID=877384 RepID=A0A4R5PMY4_9HYPH|nr:hypothetical protein [Pseudohoeflea suaedae]TDH38208.1 hypothetical protein E2A64_03555 [Pseudohoeflea suaedae]
MNRSFVPMLFAGAMLACGSAPVSAQDSADTASGRYVLERTDEGLVRLDTLTGEMSVCEQKSEQVVCKLPADERRAVNEHIAELEARIERLEKRVAALGTGPGEQDGKNTLPSDEELDEAFNMMEKFIYRFFDVFKDLDERKERPAEPGPLDPQGDDLPRKT